MASSFSKRHRSNLTPRNTFLRDTTTLNSSSRHSSQDLSIGSSSTSASSRPKSQIVGTSQLSSLTTHKCHSITYVDPPTPRKRQRVTPKSTPNPQPGVPMKKIGPHRQPLVYECPKCKRISSGEVRVEKGKNKNRWRFIVYGVDPMPIPPPAPKPDQLSSQESPPPPAQPKPTVLSPRSKSAVTIPPGSSADIFKISNQHVAYPVNKRRTKVRKKKRIIVNAPIPRSHESDTDLILSWHLPTVQESSHSGTSRVFATGANQSSSSVSKKSSKTPISQISAVKLSIPQPLSPPGMVALPPSVPTTEGDQEQQKNLGQLVSEAPANTRNDGAVRKKRSRRTRPENLEHVVDFKAFLMAAKAAGLNIADNRRVHRRTRSEAVGTRKGKRKRERTKSKQASLNSRSSSKQTLSPEAKSKTVEHEDSPRRRKTGMIASMKEGGSQTGKLERTIEVRSSKGALNTTDRISRQPDTVSLMEARPASVEFITPLIQKYRQREREIREIYNTTFPIIDRFRSSTGSNMDVIDDTNSKRRLHFASIEAVKITEKATKAKQCRKKIRKTRSAPAATPDQSGTTKGKQKGSSGPDQRLDVPHKTKEETKDPETMLKEFRTMLRNVQGKGNIKTSHIEVMDYMEGRQAQGASFHCLPKTYQQLGLPPLLRSPSSQNVLAEKMKFAGITGDTRATGEPLRHQKPVKRKQKLKKRPKIASSTVAGTPKARESAVPVKGNRSTTATSKMAAHKALKKEVKGTKSAVK